MAVALAAVLPWKWLRAAGALLGWMAGSVLRIRRDHVERAIARAGIGLPGAVADGMYASLGAGLVEFLWMAGRREARLSDLVSFAPSGVAAFEEARARGRGVVVVTAHTGNWDLSACAAAHAFAPMLVVTKRLSVRPLDRVWQAARARRGLELAPAEGAVAAVRQVLARGGVAALMVDQAPERSAAVEELEFLGARAACDLAPALLAARARAPMVVALGRRLESGKHLIEVPLVLVPPAHPSRTWASRATAQIQAEIASFVRAHPAQWLWLHRRWKPLPAKAGPVPCTDVAAAAGLLE